MTDPDSHFHVDSERQTAEIHDCGTVLRSLRSLVPDGLVDSLEWERLAGRADGLSASIVGLEFRLGDPTPNADFLLGLVPGSWAEQTCIRRGQEAPPDSPEAFLANYLAQIRDAEFPEAALIATTILEYDVGLVPGDDRWPPPGVFQKLKNPFSQNVGIREAEVAARIASAISWAVGRSDDAQESAAIRKMVAALPVDSQLTWIGAMPGRDPRMIRLLFDVPDADGLMDDLQRIGWPGPTEMVASTLDAINGQFERLAIQLEVSAQGVLPRLGLEVYVLPKHPYGFADWSRAPNPGLWRPILSRLEDTGWCLPQKASCLLAFPGREYIFDNGIFLVHKNINHVKISIEASQAREAKAYVFMKFQPATA